MTQEAPTRCEEKQEVSVPWEVGEGQERQHPREMQKTEV